VIVLTATNDAETPVAQTQEGLSKALKRHYQYSQIQILVEFLLNHINSKIPPLIIYADLVGSTNTSMTLPVDKMVPIILAFTYEFSSIIGVMKATY
jgi:adenylate cyclase